MTHSIMILVDLCITIDGGLVLLGSLGVIRRLIGDQLDPIVNLG